MPNGNIFHAKYECLIGKPDIKLNIIEAVVGSRYVVVW